MRFFRQSFLGRLSAVALLAGVATASLSPQALAQEFPDLFIQTHLSENREEIRYTCELYPEAKDYTDIYARYGLLGKKTLLGHAIHLSEREMDVLSETGSIAVHCPTSNLFLGSGLFDWAHARQRGCRLFGGRGRGGRSGRRWHWRRLRTRSQHHAPASHPQCAAAQPLQSHHCSCPASQRCSAWPTALVSSGSGSLSEPSITGSSPSVACRREPADCKAASAW